MHKGSLLATLVCTYRCCVVVDCAPHTHTHPAPLSACMRPGMCPDDRYVSRSEEGARALCSSSSDDDVDGCKGTGPRDDQQKDQHEHADCGVAPHGSNYDAGIDGGSGAGSSGAGAGCGGHGSLLTQLLAATSGADTHAAKAAALALHNVAALAPEAAARAVLQVGCVVCVCPARQHVPAWADAASSNHPFLLVSDELRAGRPVFLYHTCAHRYMFAVAHACARASPPTPAPHAARPLRCPAF